MAIHSIKASKETVNIGVIDNSFRPILEINDGDELNIEAWGMWGNVITPATTFEEIIKIRQSFSGRGPHSLTGPIKVSGAKSGMTLKVDVMSLKLGPYGFNMITPSPNSRGLLSHDFPNGEVRHFVFDEARKYTDFVGGIKLPLKPFFGIMGVAPANDGPHISSVPGDFGGNIDCPDLTVGASLYLPIWVDGALFYAGDAHAMQGCGEVTQTALETSMESARLRLSLQDDCVIKRPHAETDTNLITMGFHKDLREAAVQAVSDMVTWLATSYGLSRSDAYVLCSLQADLLITQIVNGNNGVHARLPKSLLINLNK